MSFSPTTQASKGVGTPTTRLIGLIALVSLAWVAFGGLVATPPEVTQGESVRIMYVHVPAAWVAYLAFITTAVASASGVALAEVYDLDPLSSPVRLVNVSTLGFAGTGADGLTPGFVIGGTLLLNIGLERFIGRPGPQRHNLERAVQAARIGHAGLCLVRLLRGGEWR